MKNEDYSMSTTIFFEERNIFSHTWRLLLRSGHRNDARCAATLKLVGRHAGGGVDENIKITFKKLHSENITMGGQFFHLIMK